MRDWKRMTAGALTASLLLALLTGCGGGSAEVLPDVESHYLDAVSLEVVEIENEAVALAAEPAVLDLLLPVASGVKVNKNAKAEVDYSNTADGYVMVRFTAKSDKRLKVKITGPTTSYQYNLEQGKWTAFPLSDGNGAYSVKVFEKKSADPADNKYATVLSLNMTVALTDEFAPFLRPNQYVDYAEARETIAKGAELTKDVTDTLEKVEKVYSYVVKTLTYDRDRAANVQSGYLPVLDSVLAEKKGICFDYSALMTAMLRSQGVPCKLVVGYAGTAYHAWISVWSEETGWVEGAIYFDGTTWQRMDPTFASSSGGSEAILKYIGDGSNYTTKYLY